MNRPRWRDDDDDDDQYYKCYSLHVQMPVHKDSHIYHTQAYLTLIINETQKNYADSLMWWVRCSVFIS